MGGRTDLGRDYRSLSGPRFKIVVKGPRVVDDGRELFWGCRLKQRGRS